MQPMQLGDINGLAIEAETPAEGRHQKADHDNAPAIVTGGGFVDGGVPEAFQCLSRFVSSSSWPGLTTQLADRQAQSFDRRRNVSSWHQAFGLDGS